MNGCSSQNRGEKLRENTTDGGGNRHAMSALTNERKGKCYGVKPWFSPFGNARSQQLQTMGAFGAGVARAIQHVLRRT